MAALLILSKNTVYQEAPNTTGLRALNQSEGIIMQLEDALECTVTRKEAIAEIMKHGVPIEDFFDEVGYREEYQGSDVLHWLGY